MRVRRSNGGRRSSVNKRRRRTDKGEKERERKRVRERERERGSTSKASKHRRDGRAKSEWHCANEYYYYFSSRDECDNN